MKHELDNLKGQRNYKGCIVTRIIGGFSIFNVRVKTSQEVDLLIEKASRIIQDSIVVVNRGDGAIASTNSQDAENPKINP